MKAKFRIEKEYDVSLVRVSVAVRYDDEQIPYDFPLRTGDTWNATIDVDNGQILEWPKGEKGSLHLKVCDQGTYVLIDREGNEIASIRDNYVPNSLLPGSYGDYLELDIDEDGVISNWLSNPNFSNFQDED